MNRIKQIIEDSVATERFNINSLFKELIKIDEIKELHNEYTSIVEPKIAKKILIGIIRFSYLIEPVKVPKIESTKFAYRWGDELTSDDPRRAEFEICKLISDNLFQDVLNALRDNDRMEILKNIISHTLIPYEINIDYINRITDRRIHTPDNIALFWDEDFISVFKLRESLLNLSINTYASFFSRAYDKICVKSYLTDRVLTGEHKTNREKRWECHPKSVHFALRKECLKIEKKLINQIFHFENFPDDLKTILSERRLLNAQNEVSRCPITLNKISFVNFKEEVLNPIHGKASLQVGHMHPLKSGLENTIMGHSAENISWISSVGNRIQGELSVDETQSLIKTIFSNYKEAGIL